MTYVRAAAIAAFILVTMLILLAIHGNGRGIVALDDWPHGTVICGSAVVINHGHEHDPQVQELFALADEICPG